MKVYVVDTNFFIQAHHMDYPLDVALFFWDKVKQLAQDGTIVSLDRVQSDLQNHDKELKIWCQDNLPSNFFKNSIQLIGSYRRVVEWAISQKDCYLPSALKEFLSAHEVGAWIVAHSLEHGCTVTTYESNQPEKRNQIKIPEVCDAFDVPCFNTAKMFDQLGIVF